ncbi:MAG: methylisocitrate lyase [Candidatus Heimdallarchaeota archaeon]|nr:MAG: methylisocitrate lyase [Candidatus Heimdallarchaeota archaeon]
MNIFNKSPGARLKEALDQERPLQIVGTINALMAMMAKRAGFRTIYLSGAGVANASYGLPDLGITTLDNVAEDSRRITDVVDLPLLVDIDTGFGATAFSINRTIKTLEKVGVAGVHIEDQEAQKRCGHRPRKKIVSTEEMCDRIKAAADACKNPDFMIMARTDTLANEGLQGAIDRIHQYIAAGANAIFPEAFTSLEEYKAITNVISVPVLANITEFGKTPLFSVEELSSVGVSMVLYPLTAFRAMNKAAEKVYSTLRKQGTQKSLLDIMQTRAELYELLDYYRWENILDQLGERNNV